MSLVTTTQAVKQIHADCFVIEVADIKEEVSFFYFYRMRLDATAGVCLAFLCAFRTLIALLSLQYSLNHLKIHIIDFTIHDYPTVVISAPNEVSVVLSRPRGQIFCICICILRIKAYACTSINKVNNYYVLSYSNYYTKSNKQLL